MSCSSRSNAAVHADVRCAVREHIQLELQAGLGQELHRLQPACCRTSCSVQLCLSAGEGYEVLLRAAVVDGVGTELFKGPRRTPSGFGASNRSRRTPRTRRARHGPA